MNWFEQEVTGAQQGIAGPVCDRDRDGPCAALASQHTHPVTVTASEMKHSVQNSWPISLLFFRLSFLSPVTFSPETFYPSCFPTIHAAAAVSLQS